MCKDNNRILVLIPGKNARGGITTYYQTLMPMFTLPVDFLERGARNWPVRGGFLKELIRILRDYYRFNKSLSTGKYLIVVTNTSFSSFAIIRDGIYLLIARMYKLKTITFFRGWDYKFSEKIERKYLGVFKYVYFRSEALIDLAQKNADILKKWGYRKEIYLETVTVDKDLISEVNFTKIAEKYNSDSLTILFLARLEKAKGIYEAINAFILLQKSYPKLKMTIAGDGIETNNIIRYLSDLRIDNITMTGFTEGEQISELFKVSSVYLLPSYGEGMPTSLIEAMAFGLPVVTRPVGGISDFFVNEKNGYITESKDPAILAGLIEKLILNRPLAKKMAINNYVYAQERFLSDIVVKRVENIFEAVLSFKL